MNLPQRKGPAVMLAERIVYPNSLAHISLRSRIDIRRLLEAFSAFRLILRTAHVSRGRGLLVPRSRLLRLSGSSFSRTGSMGSFR